MYEKLIKPYKTCVATAIFALASCLASYWQDWDWAIFWLGVGLFNLAIFLAQRLNRLETEIAALRGQLAAAPLPVLNPAPGQG